MSRCMSLAFLTGPTSVMAEILPGFSSMPHSVMMYPRRFPQGTPKVYFSGFNLILNRRRLLKVSSKSEIRL
jgi:hypothetical protein